MTCFSKAIDNAPNDEKERLSNVILSEISTLLDAFISLCCNHFMKFPSQDSAKSVVDSIVYAKTAATTTIKIISTLNISISYYNDLVAVKLLSSVADVFNNHILPEYTRDNGGYPSMHAFEKFIERGFACVDILKVAVMFSSKDIVLCYEYLIAITQWLLNANAWKIDNYDLIKEPISSLSAEAKSININEIMGYHKKIKEINSEHTIPGWFVPVRPKAKVVMNFNSPNQYLHNKSAY